MTTPNIHINPRVSKSLCCFFLMMHVLAAVAVFLSQVNIAFKWLACLILLASVVLLLRKHVFYQSKKSIQYFYYKQNSWWLSFKNGDEKEVKLLGNSFVTPAMTILNFRLLSSRFQRRSIILLADSLSHEQARQLRVFLPQTMEDRVRRSS